jgi:hypothetical protein
MFLVEKETMNCSKRNAENKTDDGVSRIKRGREGRRGKKTALDGWEEQAGRY